MNSSDVVSLLERMDASPPGRIENERVVSYCIGYALLVLRRFHRRDGRTLSAAGYEERDIALLSVEKLLHSCGLQPLAFLREVIRRHNPDALTAAHQLAVLHELLAYAVSDTTTTLKGEIDPAYRRIRRGLRDALNNHQDICFVKRFHRERHYHLSGAGAPDLRREECPLEVLIASLDDDGVNAVRAADYSGIVIALLRYTRAQPEYRDTLELGKITETVLLLTSSMWEADYSAVTSPSIDAWEPDLPAIIRETVTMVHTSLLRNYQRKGVYADGQASCICNALQLLLQDHAGNDLRPYHEYHMQALPEIGYEEYRTKYRARFEYIARVARDEFARRMIGFFRE